MKSVLQSDLPEPVLRVYLNANKIDVDVRARGYLDMSCLAVETTA